MYQHSSNLFPGIFFLCCCLGLTGVHAASITLAVANSTCNTIKQVGERFSARHPVEIDYICKSSGRLAKGLHGRAIEADIYISANRRWMEYMVKGGQISADKVTSPWGNRLVVSAPAASPLVMEQWSDLVGEGIHTILIGDPGTAPFGRYTKQALQRTGLWEQVKHKITTKKHITLLAETLARSDGRTVGILFSTNLNHRLQALFPVDPAWHPPIRYYMAPIDKSADRPETRQLLDFILGPEGREIFGNAGFHVTPP
ncbi:MAG: molybdate ABC transporter substrate-binding protein [Sedimenticola sp.]|nr:molybdate ABC transporter substrate-binding protein [Sedimenticola sp.]